MKKNPQQAVIGLAWYRAEQWKRLQQISDDVEILEESYESWLGLAYEKMVELQAIGLDVRKVDVDVNELLHWCNVKGLPVNAASRAEFVAERVRKQDQSAIKEE